MPSSSTLAAMRRRAAAKAITPLQRKKGNRHKVARQEERVTWAARRVAEAGARAKTDPGDPVWGAALIARRAEYQRERAALNRLLQ